MNLNEYLMNAYKKSSDRDEDASSKPQAEKKESVVRSPVFEKITAPIFERKNKDQEDTLEKARIAAKTGTWYEKKKSMNTEDVKEAAKKLTSGGLIKVSSSKNEKDNIYRRVAKFLVLIGIDEAAKILPHLSEAQTEKIIPEIASIKKITPEEAAEILDEFEGLMDKAREEGGVETAREILTKSFGSVKAQDIINKTLVFTNGKPFEYLSDLNPERINALLSGEPVGIQAIVLSQIDPKKAAGVINYMDVNTKKEVVLRLLKMKSVSPEVLKNIDESLHEKLLAQNTESSERMDGRNVLAEILKRVDHSTETKLVQTLSEEDPELGEDLKKRLFTEEDVVNADDRYLQNYLHDMETRDIAVLICGKSDGFRNKILSNVSKNRKDLILEEESLIDRLTKADSDKATSEFYSLLRRAWENGDLRIANRDEGEVFV